MEFGSGIPHRLELLTHASYAIVLSSGVEGAPHIADYLVLSENRNCRRPGSSASICKEKMENVVLLL